MTASDRKSIILEIPEEHSCYGGHFPGDPLVPGALLMAWIFEKLEQTGQNCMIEAVPTFKFLAAVRPGDQCVIHVSGIHDKRIRISCERGEEIVCEGTLLIGDCQ